MNDIQIINDEVKRHEDAMKAVVQRLKDHILSLPDNPNIKRDRVNKSCFTMSFKSLSTNLSAEHYDFKQQYKMIVAELEKCEPANIVKKLTEIIRTRVVRPNKSYTLHLHDDVVKQLISIASLPSESKENGNG